MSRKFAPISIEELKKKIDSVGDMYKLVKFLEKDLKVKFDLENYNNEDGILGYHTEENGLTYYGVSAGGDWEYPVFFMVYWDGKKIRAYIPTDGNPWNTKTKEAYGNDEEEDRKNIKKRFPELIQEDDDPDDFEIDSLEANDELIKKDFMSRISSEENTKKEKKKLDGWNSVLDEDGNENFPNNERQILVFLWGGKGQGKRPDDAAYGFALGWFDQDKKMFRANGQWERYVTHWRDLPQEPDNSSPN